MVEEFDGLAKVRADSDHLTCYGSPQRVQRNLGLGGAKGALGAFDLGAGDVDIGALDRVLQRSRFRRLQRVKLTVDGLPLGIDGLSLRLHLRLSRLDSEMRVLNVLLRDEAVREQCLLAILLLPRVVQRGFVAVESCVVARECRPRVRNRRRRLIDRGLPLRSLLDLADLRLPHLDLVLRDGGARLVDLPRQRQCRQVRYDLARAHALPKPDRQPVNDPRDRRRNRGLFIRQRRYAGGHRQRPLDGSNMGRRHFNHRQHCRRRIGFRHRLMRAAGRAGKPNGRRNQYKLGRKLHQNYSG